MKCPYCSYPESKVVDSRHSDDGLSIRRRRECLQCQRRFTTYEPVESLPIVVVKKDGSRESFDRQKVLGGMIRACEKRPVPLAELERIAGGTGAYWTGAAAENFRRQFTAQTCQLADLLDTLGAAAGDETPALPTEFIL